MRSLAGRSVARRSLKVALASALVVMGLVAPGGADTHLTPVAPLLPNLKVEIANILPESVPRISIGDHVIYRITITEEEGDLDPTVLLSLDRVTVETKLDNGVFVGPGGGCVTGTTACTTTVSRAEDLNPSFSFDVVVRATATAAPYDITITSTIEDDGGEPLDPDDLGNAIPADDSATVTTDVRDPAAEPCTYQGKPLTGATGCRSGYFPPGEHTFGAQKLFVPTDLNDETPGVIGELAEVGSSDPFCQTHGCKYTIAVLENFLPAPEYQVTDKSNPLRTTITTPRGDPCRGLGSKPCNMLRYEVEEYPQNAISPDPIIEACAQSGQIGADQTKCMDKREKLTGSGMRFEVLLLSNDPGMY